MASRCSVGDGIAEQRHQALAVEHLARLGRAGDFEERRKDVHMNRRHVARRAGLGHAGPADDERLARAAFVEAALAAAQRSVVGDVAASSSAPSPS